MREIDLQEYGSARRQLAAGERDTLLGLKYLGISVVPVIGTDDEFDIRAESTVGAVEIGDLSILIRPKIGIAQLLAIASYAPSRYRALSNFVFAERESVHDALALALINAARFAFGRGVLRCYQTLEDDLLTVRGRIAFAEQLRRRFAVAAPIAVRFDEYTDDVLANQLVNAAAHRLGRLRLRSRLARTGLAWIAGTLQNVPLVEFPRNRVPEVRFDQINEHYRNAVSLSRMILRHVGFESGRGGIRAGGFHINMNELFQEFVFRVLHEELHRFGLELRSDRELRGDRRMTLDHDGYVRLMPDISCWSGGRCTFVGDLKYKNVFDHAVPNPDLYQVLAYATAAGLPYGLLIYAKGEAEPRSYQVRNCGKTIQVVALDLGKPLNEILIDVGEVARTVARLRRVAA